MNLFPILCPSVVLNSEFTTEPCSGSKCSWWKRSCIAQATVLKEYGKHETVPPVVPCPVQFQCRWYLDAQKVGQTCSVQRLGMICEHQGGEWNTFEMACSDEW